MSLITRVVYRYKHAGSGKKVAASFAAGLILAASALRWPSDRPPDAAIAQLSPPAITVVSPPIELAVPGRWRLAADDNMGSGAIILAQFDKATAPQKAEPPLSQIEAERAAQAVADRENAAAEGKLAVSTPPIAPGGATASALTRRTLASAANPPTRATAKVKRTRERARKGPTQLAASKQKHNRRYTDSRALAYQSAPAGPPPPSFLSIFGIE